MVQDMQKDNSGYYTSTDGIGQSHCFSGQFAPNPYEDKRSQKQKVLDGIIQELESKEIVGKPYEKEIEDFEANERMIRQIHLEKLKADIEPSLIHKIFHSPRQSFLDWLNKHRI
jgi:hypothetical protein